MSRTVVCCRAEDNLSVVEEQMRVHQVRRLPVVDKEGKLVGLIALSDLAREAARQRERKRREVSADEVVATLAAICEPRQLDLREAAQLG
jgi:CBS-domain-containing membrane protein